MNKRQKKILDKYLHIKKLIFYTSFRESKKVQVGDYIDFEYTSKAGNKKKQMLKIVSVEWPSIHRREQGMKYVTFEAIGFK